MTQFTDFGLAAPILRALEGEGYTTPTPIQTQAIPPVLAGHDVLGIAQTGTGKTAAFALPILNYLVSNKRVAPRKGTRVLVLSPTRELASQIAESFKTYGAGLGLKVAVVFGGVGHKPQIDAITRGLDVLVATPGRLLDHMDERVADLGTTEILVLDEVDQMLDLGFVKPIRRVVSKLPAKRQNLFFSATMPPEIRALAAELLRNPVEVSVAPVATTVELVRQQVILVEQFRKRDILVELFGDPALQKAIIFTRTKHGADKVTKQLELAGISAAAIHGNKGQSQRERSLASFKAGEVRALVATDIAARGLDIELVSHVINYELPDVPESYVHRIGRTARAGNGGIAIAFCSNDEREQLKGIEKLIRQRLPSEDRRTGEAEPERAAQAPRGRQQQGRGRPQGQQRHSQGGGHRDGESRGGQSRDGQSRNGQSRDGQRSQQPAQQSRPAQQQAKPAQDGQPARPSLRPQRPGRRPSAGGNGDGIGAMPFMASPARG